MAEPYAHSKIKFDIQNLAATWSSEHLNSIMTKIDIKVDPAELIEKNITKEQLLAQIYTDVALADRSYEFTKPSDFPRHPDEVHKEFVLKSKIAFLTRAAIFKKLEKEALEIFLKIQHARELHAALRDYIRNLSAENYKQFMFLAEEQRNKLEEQMNANMIAELERINKEALHQWHILQVEIDSLEDRIVKLRKDRDGIFDKYKSIIINEAKHFRINGKDPFEFLGAEKRHQLDIAIFDRYQKIQVENVDLNLQLKTLKKEAENTLQKIKHRESELRKLHGPAINSAMNVEDRKVNNYNTILGQQKLNQQLSKIMGQDPELRDLKAHHQNVKAQENAVEGNLSRNLNERIVDNCFSEMLTQDEKNKIYDHSKGSDINKEYMAQDGFVKCQEEIDNLDKEFFKFKERKDDKAKAQLDLVKKTAELNNNVRNYRLAIPKSSLFDKLDKLDDVIKQQDQSLKAKSKLV